MGILDSIGRVLQVPQAALMGAFASVNHRAYGDKDLAQRLADAGLAYDDQRTDAEKRADATYTQANNLFSGMLAGVRNGLHPSDFNAGPGNIGSAGIPGKILNSAEDMAIDPLVLAGSAAKGAMAAGDAGPLLTKLGTVFGGESPEAVDAGSKLKQLFSSDALARTLGRTYQGTLATGNPLTGFGVGALQGIGEGIAGAAARRLGNTAAEGAIGSTANTINDAVETASQPNAAAAQSAQGLRFNGVPSGSQQRLPGILDNVPSVPKPVEAPLPTASSPSYSTSQLPFNNMQYPVNAGPSMQGQLFDTGQSIPGISAPTPTPSYSPAPYQTPEMLLNPQYGTSAGPAYQGQLPGDWQQAIASHPYEAQSSTPQIAWPGQAPPMSGQQQLAMNPTTSMTPPAPSGVSDAALAQKLMEILGNNGNPVTTLARRVRPKVL